MQRWKLVATLAALTVSLGTMTTARALEQSDPPVIRDSGGWGSSPGSPGPGDPSLDPSGMPAGGDAAGVAAAERAEKAAERKTKEAERKREEERKKEEERKRREAEAARSPRFETRNASSATLFTKQFAKAAPPIASVASAPSMTGTRRTTLHFGNAAPSSLNR